MKSIGTHYFIIYSWLCHHCVPMRRANYTNKSFQSSTSMTFVPTFCFTSQLFLSLNYGLLQMEGDLGYQAQGNSSYSTAWPVTLFYFNQCGLHACCPRKLIQIFFLKKYEIIYLNLKQLFEYLFTMIIFQNLFTKGTFGTLNEDYDRNCNLYY